MYKIGLLFINNAMVCDSYLHIIVSEKVLVSKSIPLISPLCY